MTVFRQPISRRFVPFLLGGLLWTLSGCDRAEPVTYRVPKEERDVTAPMPPANTTASTPAEETNAAPSGTAANRTNMQVLPGMAEAADAAGDLTYSVPEGWEETPPSGIRKANFTVTDAHGSAEVTVLVFPGDVGGTLANINRWRAQIGMEPASENDLPAFTEPYRISAHGGLFVRITGPKDAILGGLLPFHGNTWFFKMQGTIRTVLEQEAPMKEFLDSVKLEDHHH